MYFIIEDYAEFFVEGQSDRLMASEGDVVFIPRGRVHAVYFTSEMFRTLLVALVASDHAVQMNAYFRAVSEPAKSMSLPSHVATYATGTPEDMEKAVEIAHRIGIHFLSLEETKARLPNYPGFGANLERGA